jgi:hypothetical protein
MPAYLFKIDGSLNKIGLKTIIEDLGVKTDNAVNKSDKQTIGGDKTFTGQITLTNMEVSGSTVTNLSVVNSTITNLSVTNLTLTNSISGIWKVIYYAVNLSSTTTYTISDLDSSQVKMYKIRFNYHQGATAAECKFLLNGRASGEYVARSIINGEGTAGMTNQNDTNFFEVAYAYKWCQGEILIYPRSKYTTTNNFPSIQFWSTSNSNDGMYVYYTYSGGGQLQVNEDITSVAFTGATNTVGYGSEFTIEELR